MYLDIIFGINVLFNFLVLILTNYITRAHKRRIRMLSAAVFASIIVPMQWLLPHPFLHSFIFKWSFCFLIIFVAFGYHGIYVFTKRFSTFIFVLFTAGGGLFALQYFIRESDMLTSKLLVVVSNLDGDPISLVLLICCLPVILFFVKGRMDGHVKETLKYDQIYQISIEFDGIEKSTTGFIDSGNQMTDPFSGKPVAVCDEWFLQQFFPEEAWDEIVRAIATGGYHAFPPELQKRLSIVPYQGVGGGSGLMYCLKPDSLTVYYEEDVLTTSHVLIGIQTVSLTVDGSYHCLLHPGLIQLNMKQSA